MEANSKVNCHFCGKLLRESGLRRHVALVHYDLRNYECNICGKRVPTNVQLSEHINEKHLNVEQLSSLLLPCVIKV